MKVLVISVDVSNLSDDDAEELRSAMEEQVEVVDNAAILNSGVNELEVDDDDELEYLH